MVSFLTVAVVSTNVVAGWNLFLLYRQYHAHRETVVVPKSVEEIVGTEDFGKTQRYTRSKLKYEFLREAFETLETNTFLKYKLFPVLWYASQRLCGYAVGSFAHCCTFGLVSEATNTLLHLPWRYYFNFHLEAAHGFNKMTLAEFVKDTIKTFLLKVCVVNPLNAAIVNFVVRKFGRVFPLYMFGAGTAVSIAAMYIIPVLVLPLFNKFTALPEDSSLFLRIKDLAEKLRFPLTKIFEVDGSRRSAHSNAYFYGFFNNKRIVLYDTLMKQLEEDEILAVLCHEFGHWYHNHVLCNLGLGLGQLAAICFSAREVIFNTDMYGAFGFQAHDLTPLVGFSLFCNFFLPPVLEGVSVVMCALSRTFEFQADRFAISQGFGDQLRSGLLKMQKENLISLTPDWIYAACRYSHPPLPERLDAIDENLKKAK